MNTLNENFVISTSVYLEAMKEMQRRKNFTESEIDDIFNECIHLSCPLIPLDADHNIIFPLQRKYARKFKISQREGILMTETRKEINPNVEIPDNLSFGEMLDQRFQLVYFTGDLRTLRKYQTHVFLFNTKFLEKLIKKFK